LPSETARPPARWLIYLKDIVKGGIKQRFAELRNRHQDDISRRQSMTAAAIAAEAGVDDFLAQATPEAKLKLIAAPDRGGSSHDRRRPNDAPAWPSRCP